MFVCICNALRDSQIKQVAQLGAGCVEDAYAALGAQVQCGQCREDAEDVIRSAASAPGCTRMLQAAE
jgi:bacterioferritin-associated ferredoxin